MLPFLWLSVGLAAVLSPPYKQDNWVVLDDAKVTDTSILLAGLPGQSGSVWTKEPNLYDEWTMEAVIFDDADADKDAHNSGFAIWYTEEPNMNGEVHGGQDQWDGLGLMVDTLDSQHQGSIRAHLNDKSFEFMKSTDYEVDALSLCRMAYRSSKSPITIKLGYSKRGFVVTVNGQSCFSTQYIVLPKGYFGVSANSDQANDKLHLRSISIISGMDADMVQILDDYIVRDNKRKEQALADSQAPKAEPEADIDSKPEPKPEPKPKPEEKPGQKQQQQQGTHREFPPVMVSGLKKEEVDEIIEAKLAGMSKPTTNEHLEVELELIRKDLETKIEILQRNLDHLEAHLEAKIAKQKPEVPVDVKDIQRQIDHLVTSVGNINQKQNAHQQSETAHQQTTQPTPQSPGLLKIGVFVVLLQIITLFVLKLFKNRKSHPKLL